MASRWSREMAVKMFKTVQNKIVCLLHMVLGIGDGQLQRLSF